MRKHIEVFPENTPDAASQTKFPYLHLFAGLVISFFSFVFLVWMYYLIVSLIFTDKATVGDVSPLVNVFKAYLIPECIILGALIFLATKAHKINETGRKRSYMIMITINAVCFFMVCYVMGSVGC
jgi:hypothetical protein